MCFNVNSHVSFRVSLTFAWWWRWQRPALCRPRSSAEQSRNPTSCLQLFPWTALSVPPAMTQSESMSCRKNIWFHITDQTHHQPPPWRVLLTVKDFLFWALQCLWAPVGGVNSSAVWDGESDPAAHEGDYASGTWSAPLPPSRAKRTSDRGLPGGSAWQPTRDTTEGKKRSLRAFNIPNNIFNLSNNIKRRDEDLFILLSEDPTLP